ncbi:MAG: YbhB/YbcL family Raf kinase inhibitor-like protein [Proteobacteria bacterium]|nr:YbhB/YbcL family Raf kinase inhibitor-like protein [Pseudomonadota bacterium]MBI3499559.1 YbhB/YbcL family Raf kinase inhibitor-like protein [Pseudomonadota bacterium]
MTKQAIFSAAALAATVALALAAPSLAAGAAKTAALRVSVDRIARTNDPIPAQYAFCVPSAQGHTAMGANKNPRIHWSKGPAGTQSYAIIVHDTDVPSKFDDANKEGRTISKDLKRIDFVHMVLVDIPAAMTEIAEGKDSDKVTPKGKPPGKTDHGVRGVNDYGKFMSGDMAGAYGGYDGPCPPWNDSIPHHYHFVVYALDVPNLNLSGNFGAAEVRKAVKGHVLGRGNFTAAYTQNPDVELMAKK